MMGKDQVGMLRETLWPDLTAKEGFRGGRTEARMVKNPNSLFLKEVPRSLSLANSSSLKWSGKSNSFFVFDKWTLFIMLPASAQSRQSIFLPGSCNPRIGVL